VSAYTYDHSFAPAEPMTYSTVIGAIFPASAG
jgi:hypothetical protein